MKIIGWILYIAGIILLVELANSFIECIQLVFGTTFVLAGNCIIDSQRE